MAEYPVTKDPGPPPVVRLPTSPGTLERRAANASARSRGESLMPYHEDDAERFRLLYGVLQSIDRNLQEWTDAHRKPATLVVNSSASPEATAKHISCALADAVAGVVPDEVA